MDLKQWIRDVPNFPMEGIIFKDITPLLAHPPAFRYALGELEKYCRDKRADTLVAIEARGYILAAPLADRLGIGFVPARKPGKLPWEKIREEYQLEYGTAALEVHADAITQGQRVVIVDDVIATGGTLSATRRLVERLGGQVMGIACLVELSFLNGRRNLDGYDFFSLVRY
ncbi:MAG: adenine phosphoribosyltransferase [Armatimonadetes bacterium]|nr:adenine phosphoribosyltransferase [Armatimonadota bacterium]